MFRFVALIACFASFAPRGDAARPRSESAEGNDLIEIGLSRAKQAGPLFVERFDGAELNRDLWTIVNGDTGIEVVVAGGELRIHGRTGPDKPQGYNHVGLFGKVFRESNAVGLARIRAAKGFGPAEAGSRQCHVHLCGCYPDYNSTVCFGANRQEAGWSFSVRDWDRMKQAGPMLEPQGNESKEFTTVRVEHLNGESRGFILRDGKWAQVGEARPTAHGAARLELKVTITPREQECDMRVADAWMYPHPRVAPVRFIVTNDWAHTIPRLGAYRDKPLRLEVREAESGDLLGAANLNKATGEFSVTLEDKRAYPVAAKIAILHEGKPIARADIQNKDLDGLYPGDVCSITENAAQKQPPGGRPSGR